MTVPIGATNSFLFFDEGMHICASRAIRAVTPARSSRGTIATARERVVGH